MYMLNVLAFALSRGKERKGFPAVGVVSSKSTGGGGEVVILTLEISLLTASTAVKPVKLVISCFVGPKVALLRR
jgi:hypothetical protein